MMIRGGDALEVKKIQAESSQISLNSSYPKNKLFKTSAMLTDACRTSEDWVEKDLLYVVGRMEKTTVTHVWLVQGVCWMADSETYERVRDAIADGVGKIPALEFASTKELGRVNRVDPLGITHLRIRGMWQIDHPKKVFDYLLEDSPNHFAVCLLTKNKYLSIFEEDRLWVEQCSQILFKHVKIKSPNNPSNLLDAVLILILE